MKRVLIPGVILCGADVAQAVDDKNMYMHFFEEMTVYAPVPVPVNGNTHYTSESIERLPTGNGNISDLLRTNPAVRMDSTQSTSLNQGDIRPEKSSIHGASPYQNAYLIDGISATNNLNPANESDASSATNISGMSQGYYLDVSLLDNVTLYDSFVPVEFGRFNGGVIDAKIKRFNTDDSNVKLGYRTTRSDWLTSHIDENNKSAFNQGSSGSTYYSPDFKKNFYTLSFNQELADNFGVTAGLSRRQSDIIRADYVSNDGIVAGRAQYKNVIDTALSKFTWFASDRFTHDLTLKYTGSSRDYNTSTFPESDREMGNKSYGLAWDMDTQLAWAKLRTSGGTARSVRIAPDYKSLFFRVNARDDNMQDAANALMAELATIDQHGFSAEELDDVKSTRLTWLKNAVDQQAERDLRMLTSRLASSSLNNTPFLSPEETYQLSKRLWQQITVQSLAEKWQQLRKNQDAFWEQMVNNEVAAKKALSPAAILALEKEYANKKLAAYIFPGRNLSLTVDADPQAEISSKETLAENLTSLTLSNGAKVILAKSAGEEQKLQIIAVSNKGDLSFPAQQKSLIALANKAVSGSGVGELSSSSLKRWSAENSVTMSSKVSGMNTLLSVSARTNNPEPGFQLINQRITHSTINDNIWASLQNAQIQALKTLDQRPAEKFAQQMYETRYADDRTKLLQENQIAQFTAADALAADRQLFSSPADITFVIVGNVAEDKLVALITRYLGSIKHSDSPLAAGKPLTRATDNASVTVKEQNEPVAQVSQWKRYDSRTPVNLETRMALDAFNVALAKDLRVNIREQASGAYSVSSRLSVDPQAKDISHLLAFTCQPERHDELLTLANEVMVKRLAKGISEQELNEYQQNVQRSLDIQQRSVQQLANTIVNSLIQYDDPAAWTEQEQLLKQMTVENVNTAVKQYLSHPVNTYTGVLLPK